MARSAPDDRGHRRHKTRRLTTGGASTSVRTIKVRDGIKRQPDRERRAQDLPTSERHERILAAMSGELTGASKLARQLDLSTAGLTSSLYALADRGLVERVPRKGWRRLA